MSIKTSIINFIASIQKEIVVLKNEKAEAAKQNEKNTDEIFCEILTVLDTFERSEDIIKERELDKDENTSKAIKRLLNAKKKLLFVLEKYNIKEIEFENNKSVEEYCIVTDTETNSTRETGDIISIEKKGFKRNDHLLRPAEVVIVKN